ncbi:nucleoporin protein Ndc1-Nup [Leptodontidium sp. 2 PMI_412]|nr:nucleoporin protein Ndc1-Nup [Leptodontidium sp. 2 PMI_412]
MAPTPRIRPYKDFLTPALHKWFSLASAIVFALCYVESFLIGEKNSLFWSWFPIGKAGIRALLLFIPGFVIFIPRIGHLHVGLRTSYSPWDTFQKYATTIQVPQTIGWYCASAWFFSEVYVWSASKDQDLNRIKLMPKTDRTMLNEKPIYLTSFLLFLAVIQAAFHLFYDYDRIDMPAMKTKPWGATKESKQVVTPPAELFQTKLPSIIVSALKRAVIAAVTFPFIYILDLGLLPSIRSMAWGFTRQWATLFWTLSKSTSVPSVKPFHWSVLKNSATSGFLLIMLWEVTNAAFSAYVAQEPLKNERPITHESRDPNGSLLSGLKGKKLQTRAFAFWELVYIGERFQGRRKQIYTDIDRPGGSTWSQILAVCMEVINGIQTRIADYEKPPSTGASNSPKVPEPPIQGLPRMAEPIQQTDIFTKPKKRGTRESVGQIVKNHGQSPPSPVSPRAKKLLEKAETMLSPASQDDQSLAALLREWTLVFLKYPVSWPFRQTYRRRITAIVLGQPYGDVGVLVDAVDAVTRFSVCSLTEDEYGHVQRDVKSIIQTLTTTVMKLEALKANLGFHWTDIERKQECPEVDIVLEACKIGLNELVTAFGDYSEDLRLSQSEMRAARLAATPAPKKPEMIQAS